jgi:hypothetical protein
MRQWLGSHLPNYRILLKKATVLAFWKKFFVLEKVSQAAGEC